MVAHLNSEPNHMGEGQLWTFWPHQSLITSGVYGHVSHHAISEPFCPLPHAISKCGHMGGLYGHIGSYVISEPSRLGGYMDMLTLEHSQALSC